MCTVFVLVVAMVTAVSAAPQINMKQSIFNEEDPSPVQTVTTCGGRIIESTSAAINYQVGGSIRADQRCVWTIKAPYDSTRFRLVSSGLSENDGIFVTNFANSMPGTQQRVLTVGQNYSVPSGTVIVTLSVGHAPTRGFSLEFYSSGSVDSSRNFTNHFSTSGETGNHTYPNHGGDYDNFENALFIVSPSTPRQSFLSFLAFDLEGGTSCEYDVVTIYNWFNGTYLPVTRSCGSTLPPTITLEEGVGLITFTSDDSVTARGFSFQWM